VADILRHRGRGPLTMAFNTNGKTKICLVTPEFPPDNWGGLARSAERVAYHAQAMGLEVHVARFKVLQTPFVLLDENRESSEISTGITLHRITVGREDLPEGHRELWDCPHTLTLRMMYQSLEMLHRDLEFDLFHSFFLYPVGYVTGLLAHRFDIPTVVTIVGNDVKKYGFSPEKVALCRNGLENATRVVGLSRDLVEMADALAPIAGKARIIYNSVAIPERSWNRKATRTTPFRIGCGGIFKYAKGLPYLFKAIAMLRSDHGLVLEMPGVLRKSEKAVWQHMLDVTGIGDLLFLRDPIPHAQMSEWLRSLDAFVLPSVSEGCPNILMEAMASGVPCVATNTGAVEELIENHVSGIMIPWGDSQTIADALREIFVDPDLSETLGAAARSRMKEFSAEREHAGWKKVYGELISL
jgi:L-malate glycosyltransferase